jgi:hypothetical protein
MWFFYLKDFTGGKKSELKNVFWSTLIFLAELTKIYNKSYRENG